MSDKKTVLKQYFGHTEFRAGQEQVVDAILSGRDALCVMPTGAGKSVCYQVPALLFSGVTLVVSPLISLMKDQVNALTQNGIRAAYLNSSLTAAQYGKVLENIRLGMYKILYVAPERLGVSGFLDACRTVKIDLIAVDEAHCVSQWGQDFRPSYLKIPDFICALGYRPTVAAFTATATANVKEDIERALALRTPFRITTGFDRPNLRLSVLRPKKKFDALLALLEEHGEDTGIVYCATRKTVEEVSAALTRLGYGATAYHAGLDDDVRKQNQEDFVYDRKRIMVATNAFGMGIDKSNVAFVIHYNMPKDLESYYQEAGRAGRDGADAECVLLYSPKDVGTARFLIEHSEPNPDLSPEEEALLKARDYERLKQMTFYSTVSTCLRSFILRYFGEKASDFCGNCSNCLSEFDETDVTLEAQKILSCVKRTGECFGKKMICDVLRGSKSERILRLGLDGQTTYGLMKDRKTQEVTAIIDHLTAAGYLESVGTAYPTLLLTDKANAVLFDGCRVFMKQIKPKKDARKAKKAPALPLPSTEPSLLASLKALRLVIAEEKGVPAYVVFSNATLEDMCKKRPQTMAGMLDVSGVGHVKLAMYGERFLALLKNSQGEE